MKKEITIERIVNTRGDEIRKNISDSLADELRELYCMLAVFEKGESARKEMNEDEYYLALGSLDELE